MGNALLRVERPRFARRRLLELLLGLSSGCVRSGHSDHYLWMVVEQRSAASASALTVHANRSASLVIYGSKRADGSRESGPSFDYQLSPPEMQQLLALLEPARTAAYFENSALEGRSRSAEAVLSVAVDARVIDAPSNQSLSLHFLPGHALRPETRAFLDYLSQLQRRLYERGTQLPQSAPRANWARPVTFQ